MSFLSIFTSVFYFNCDRPDDKRKPRKSMAKDSISTIENASQQILVYYENDTSAR